MGALVFIIFCFFVLVGVILIIVYFSMPKNKAQAAGSILTTTAIQERGTTAMDIHNPNAKSNFTENFFKEKILEVRESENIVYALITTWTTRFKGSQERQILRDIEKWYKEIKNVSNAEAEALIARMKAEDAKIDMLTSKSDDYLEARKKSRIRAQQAEIAELEARIREANQKGQKPEPEKEERSRKPLTEEEVRKRLKDLLSREIRDEIEIARIKAEEIADLDEAELMEINEVRKNPSLGEEERKRRINAINARYENLRNLILQFDPKRR